MFAAILNTVSLATILTVIVLSATPDYRNLSLMAYLPVAALCYLVPQGQLAHAGGAVAALVYWALLWASPYVHPLRFRDVTRRRVVVFSGKLPSGTPQVFNTHDPSANLFRHLPESVNGKGGRELTWSFWIKPSGDVKDTVLFLRGDTRAYSAQALGGGGTSTREFQIAMPMIRMYDRDHMELSVNTDARIMETVDLHTRASEASRRAVLALTPSRWTHIVLTFTDAHAPVLGASDFAENPRGTASAPSGMTTVRMYVNGQMYSQYRLQGVVRPNTGPLHVFPKSTSNDDIEMADLVYHNYALCPAGVAEEHKRGHSNKVANVTSAVHSARDWQMSSYNIHDVYNIDTDLHS